jgi:hypothetical protein
MAAVDLASVSAMLWRNDRPSELLITWINVLMILSCVVCAGSAARVVHRREADSVPRRRMLLTDDPPVRLVDRPGKWSDAVPTDSTTSSPDDDFLSEEDLPSQRHAS